MSAHLGPQGSADRLGASQAAVLAAVLHLHAAHRPCTYGPLMAATGLSSKGSVAWHVHRLERAGLVRREPGTTGTLRPAVAVLPVGGQ